MHVTSERIERVLYLFSDFAAVTFDDRISSARHSQRQTLNRSCLYRFLLSFLHLRLQFLHFEILAVFQPWSIRTQNLFIHHYWRCNRRRRELSALKTSQGECKIELFYNCISVLNPLEENYFVLDGRTLFVCQFYAARTSDSIFRKINVCVSNCHKYQLCGLHGDERRSSGSDKSTSHRFCALYSCSLCGITPNACFLISMDARRRQQQCGTSGPTITTEI